MATSVTTEMLALQARIARYQEALDALLCGDKRSNLEASTGAGSNRVGYFKPDEASLRIELTKAQSRLASLQGDLGAVRRAFWL